MLTVRNDNNTLELYDGISIEKINKEGSEGQKIAAPLFDNDNNGILENSEFEHFNMYHYNNTKLDHSNVFTMTTKQKNKNNQETIEIHYTDISDLSNKNMEFTKFVDRRTIYLGEHSMFSYTGKFQNTTINLITGHIEVNGKGDDANIFARNINLTVKNADVKEINVFGKNSLLELKNVKDKEGLKIKPTQITIDNSPKITTDKNCNIETKHFKG